MKKVNTYYGDLSQADFNEFLTYIQNRLKDNENFPSLPVALTVIATLQTEWQLHLSKSKAGDHEATTKAKALQNELASKVRKIGIYINETANGDEAMLETSGYTMGKEPEYQNKPDIKVVQGENSGSGTVVIEAIPGAVIYLVEIAPDPKPAPDNNSTWKRLPMSTKSTIPFSGLEPYKQYWVKFCYATINGESDYSEPKPFSVN